MSDPPASSPPVPQATNENDVPAGIDFTAILPLEVLVYMLDIGAFDHRQLAPLRLVNHALCDAASDPSFYRIFRCRSVAKLAALPPFVATSLHRLSFSNAVDLGDISGLVPNLTSLVARGYRVSNEEGIATLGKLRELCMFAGSTWGVTGSGGNFLSQLANLECLEVAQLQHVAPIASLTTLRRLNLGGLEGDILGDLLSAFSSAPFAGTLEALCLAGFRIMPGLWMPLSDLNRLREFSLTVHGSDVSPEHAEAFADILAAHPTLAVVHVDVSDTITAAIVRRGFPSNLKVLGLSRQDQAGVDDLLAALPPDLAALYLTGGCKYSLTDVRTLLLRCPRLRAVEINFDDETVEHLASGSLADRPLILNRLYYSALESAGHHVGYLQIGVHWRIAGGVICDGKAVAC